MNHKILILGGTGAMGKHLVDLLEGTDNEVVVTSRSARQSRNNIRYVQGNAHDMNFVLPLMQDGVDVVVNFMVYNTQEFGDVIETYLSHCKQYIHLSTARVYSDVDEVITEDTPRLLDVSKDEEYLATGVQHSVREFCYLAFKTAGIELEFKGEGIDEKGYDKKTGRCLIEVSADFYRPTDVVNLLGDSSKAKKELGWNPAKTSFEELVSIMVTHDMQKVAADHVANVMQTNLAEYLERGVVK